MEKESSATQRACMTAEQFDEHLMELMGRHAGSKRVQALRMVLVEGVTAYEAAKRVGVDVSGVTRAVTEVRKTLRHVAALNWPPVRMPPTRKSSA